MNHVWFKDFTWKYEKGRNGLPICANSNTHSYQNASLGTRDFTQGRREAGLAGRQILGATALGRGPAAAQGGPAALDEDVLFF